MQDSRETGGNKENKQAWAEEAESGNHQAGNGSLFALYMILIISSTGHRVKSELDIEDPGFTHNFFKYDLSQKLYLLNETTVAAIKLVGGQDAVTQTKVYKMCLSDMQGRRHQAIYP